MMTTEEMLKKEAMRLKMECRLQKVIQLQILKMIAITQKMDC